MEVLGYVAYGVLVVLALTWSLGVRMKPDLGVHTIAGALSFAVSAILLPLSGANLLHAIWLIALGFAVPVAVMLVFLIPALYKPIRLVASMYAILLRIGR